MRYLESWMIIFLYIIFAPLAVMLGYLEFKIAVSIPLIFVMSMVALAIPFHMIEEIRNFYIRYYDSAEAWGWQHKFKIVDIQIRTSSLFIIRTTRRIPWYRNHYRLVFKKQEGEFSCLLRENLPSNPTKETLANYNLIEPLTYPNYSKEEVFVYYDSLSFYNQINGIISKWYLMNHQKMVDSDFSEMIKENPIIWAKDGYYGRFESFWITYSDKD